jgi:hypothetical protein
MSLARLLLLGNSHLAALKLGWDEVADDYPGLRCTFFGAPAKWTRHAVLRNGTITIDHEPLAEKVMAVSGGRRSIAVEEFDAVCIVGMYFGFSELVRELRDVRTYDMKPMSRDSPLVSQACLEQLVRDALSGSAALEWATKIRQACNKAVFLAPAPLPAESRVTADRFGRAMPRHFRANAEYIFESYRRVACALTTQNGIDLIEQPASTIASPGFTKNEFSRGSVRLLGDSVAHAQEDFSHMNKLYGVALFREIVTTVERALEGRATAS